MNVKSMTVEEMKDEIEMENAVSQEEKDAIQKIVKEFESLLNDEVDKFRTCRADLETVMYQRRDEINKHLEDTFEQRLWELLRRKVSEEDFMERLVKELNTNSLAMVVINQAVHDTITEECDVEQVVRDYVESNLEVAI